MNQAMWRCGRQKWEFGVESLANGSCVSRPMHVHLHQSARRSTVIPRPSTRRRLPRIVLSGKVREIIRLPRWLLCVLPLPLFKEPALQAWLRMFRPPTLLLVVGIGDRLVVWLMMGIISSEIETIVRQQMVRLVTDSKYSWQRRASRLSSWTS